MAAALLAGSLVHHAFAQTAQPTQTQRQYLSGTDRDNTVPWEFYCTAGKNSGKWTTIPVPSCWDMIGFGNLHYYTDRDPVEQGQYRHRFTVPAGPAGGRTFLVFDGVMTDTDAKLNGKSVGPVHQGGFYQFKYDVTDLLKRGEENLLEVNVKRKSDNESVNRAERMADYYIFAGIFRPVFLEFVPQQFIERVAINAKADGSFYADVITPTVQNADTVKVEILDKAGSVVGTATGKPGAPVTLNVANPQTWTAETPNLYTARFRLQQGESVLHETTQRFGFRTVEVRAGDGIYVNGKRVILKGVNRHAAWPTSGRTLTPALDREDIRLIREMNMNSVRMSHYPPDKSFLELCDEMGLYVLNELAGWQKSYDAPTSIRLAGQTVRRDVNHPSILFWDNGNEGGWNTAADPEFKKWDPQKRNVIHPWGLHENMETRHYSSYVQLKELLNGPNLVMPTEFLHGLFDGGIGAGFRDYWDLMSASPKNAGGFFWVFADEGMVRPDSKFLDLAGNAAPDGVVGPYREKEASFYTVREIWSPVQLPARLPADFGGTLPVKNEYDFTSLKDVKFKWSLIKYRGPDDAEAGHTVVGQGDIASPDVAARANGNLTLTLPADRSGADALAVSATDAAGLEIIRRVYTLDATKSYAPTTAGKPAANGQLTSGDVTLVVDPATGAIQSTTKAGQALAFKGGPRLALGKPPVITGRQGGGNNPQTNAPPPVPPGEGKLTKVEWTSGEDGWFCFAYTIQAKGPVTHLGVTFDLPVDQVKGAKFLGNGPYRVYQNRMEGGTVDVWNKVPNNTITGWKDFVYPEFRGYYSDVRWAKLNTTNGAIRIVPETRGLFLHLLTPDSAPENLTKNVAPGYPDGQISVLHAINAMGNKFGTPQSTGPQGEPFNADGEYSGKVWLRFE
ncbi:MAG TPA: glycoside hydrolase family 2 TIM barrel-domain containing protein [Tepidisphaeraceae bacterium]